MIFLVQPASFLKPAPADVSDRLNVVAEATEQVWQQPWLMLYSLMQEHQPLTNCLNKCLPHLQWHIPEVMIDALPVTG